MGAENRPGEQRLVAGFAGACRRPKQRGLRILAVLFWFTLNRRGVRRSRRFDSLRARYTRLR